MKKFDKNNPFKTPEGYFEGFTDDLLGKSSEEKRGFQNEDGFSVPEGYFDGLHNNIQQKLNPESTKVVTLYPYRNYYIAAASVAAVVLFVFGLNWNSVEAPTFGELADAEIEAYFDDNELGFSPYEIAEVLPIDELEVNDILENQFNDENVIDYLYENISDFEELNLEEHE